MREKISRLRGVRLVKAQREAGMGTQYNIGEEKKGMRRSKDSHVREISCI